MPVQDIDPKTRVITHRPTAKARKVRPKPPQLTYTVEEAAEVLGIGRGLAYIMVRDGSLPAIRVGKRRILVPKAALEAYLENVQSMVPIHYAPKHGLEVNSGPDWHGFGSNA